MVESRGSLSSHAISFVQGGWQQRESGEGNGRGAAEYGAYQWVTQSDAQVFLLFYVFLKYKVVTLWQYSKPIAISHIKALPKYKCWVDHDMMERNSRHWEEWLSWLQWFHSDPIISIISHTPQNCTPHNHSELSFLPKLDLKRSEWNGTEQNGMGQNRMEWKGIEQNRRD